MVGDVGAAEGLPDGLRKQLSALANLEAALVEHLYSYPLQANEHLKAAQEAVGFSAELTGT